MYKIIIYYCEIMRPPSSEALVQVRLIRRCLVGHNLKYFVFSFHL